jgi:hypothetical protein
VATTGSSLAKENFGAKTKKAVEKINGLLQ